MIEKEQKRTFEQNYALGLKYLARAVKTELEVKRYLEKNKVPEADIEKIIAKLKEYKYINDDEYARIFAENKMQVSMSSFAVKYGLKQKGIEGLKADEIVSRVYEDFDEKEAAREIALKRAEKLDGLATQKKITRIASYLKRKGFCLETIYHALEPVISQLNKEG